ncbi:MAG: tRNA glutamyl-Q(34) synthetase GluQRS [Acetobacteraceae bacterium]|nr:tRNA glutamyl-Q(34) synthetase GluQRS [Acetobacteraceae bacterium]
MPPATVVTRFAPSPTGYLHLGHAFAALFAHRLAAEAGGRFLLRIEDIDPLRCRPEFAAAIEEDLAWLGLAWERPVRVQSEHLADYRRVLEALAARGLVYPCFCTRADIAREIAASAEAPHQGPDGPHYPGTCRALREDERRGRIAAGAPYALRLDMARAAAAAGPLAFREAGEPRVATPEIFGDVVLGRKDTPASYHLCVTHDDAAQGVTLVTRAEDLRPATHLHRLLQALLGWQVPQWRHHPLRVGPDGRRHAKRDRSVTLRDLRAAGHTPAAVRALAGLPD